MARRKWMTSGFRRNVKKKRKDVKIVRKRRNKAVRHNKKKTVHRIKRR